MIIDLTPKNRTGLWFAWRPVWVGRKLVWLKYVERHYGQVYDRKVWVYRLPVRI